MRRERGRGEEEKEEKAAPDEALGERERDVGRKGGEKNRGKRKY